jgi:heme/copper-type cytochrome/quinol oxidase subunit 1
MTSLQTVRIGCAIAMIIGVFMPWIRIFGATLPGHQILKLADFRRVVGGHGSTETLLVFLPLVILILAPITILTEIAASPETRRTDIAGLITGVAPFIGLAYFLGLAGQQGFQALEVGSYLTLAAAGILFVASFDHASASGGTGTSGKDTLDTSSGF